MSKGRVIGIDIEIRPHNRKAIEAHELSEYITLLEGSSTSDEIVAEVRDVRPGETVLVLLDLNQTKAHVLGELQLYSPFVSIDSYIVACDGIMAHLVGAPRSQPDWSHNNPLTAIQAFLAENANFEVDEPVFPFNEGTVTKRVTYWPSAFLRAWWHSARAGVLTLPVISRKADVSNAESDQSACEYRFTRALMESNFSTEGFRPCLHRISRILN